LIANRVSQTFGATPHQLQGTTMRLRLSTPIAAACLLLGAAASHADTVNFLGYANGSAGISYAIASTPAPVSGSAGAGGIATTLNGGPSFVTFCVDLYDHIGFTSYTGYTLVPPFGHAFTNPNAYADLGRLFTAYGSVNTASATNSAAFQVAVWEIAYETAGTYSLTSGNAQFGGDAGALSQASTWLGSLGSANSVNINVLEGHSITPTARQDMVFSTPVPEPDTYALMLAGLAGMGFLARRRMRQA
jgi:hypothetical protein